MITNLMKEEEDDKLKRVIVRGVVSIVRSEIFDDDYDDDDKDDDDTCNSGHNDN